MVRAAIPLLVLGILLMFFWPGSLAPPAVGGPFRIVIGLAFLLFSLKFLERAPLLEGTLHFGQDPWVLPFDLRPLGAVWGLREEALAGLLLALLLALFAEGRERLAALTLLAAAWAGLVLPALGFSLFGALLERAALRKNDGACCLLRPRLFRMVGGLASLLLVLVGAWALHHGVRQVALIWGR